MPDGPSKTAPDARKYRKRAVTNAVRREVCARAGVKLGDVDKPVQCHYCDAIGYVDWLPHYPTRPIIGGLEFDHVIPEFYGGPTTADNLVLACRPCNRRKGHRLA